MTKYVFLFVILALPAFADSPSTTCPSGYQHTINATDVYIATTCPSGTISVGTAESCLGTTTNGECYMYAPVGMSFTDDSGTYEFTDVCPMSD